MNKKHSGVQLYVGDSVTVSARPRLFSGSVGEVVEIHPDGRYTVEFISAGVFLGSGLYERGQIARCAPLIPLLLA